MLSVKQCKVSRSRVPSFIGVRLKCVLSLVRVGQRVSVSASRNFKNGNAFVPDALNEQERLSERELLSKEPFALVLFDGYHFRTALFELIVFQRIAESSSKHFLTFNGISLMKINMYLICVHLYITYRNCYKFLIP